MGPTVTQKGLEIKRQSSNRALSSKGKTMKSLGKICNSIRVLDLTIRHKATTLHWRRMKLLFASHLQIHFSSRKSHFILIPGNFNQVSSHFGELQCWNPEHLLNQPSVSRYLRPLTPWNFFHPSPTWSSEANY